MGQADTLYELARLDLSALPSVEMEYHFGKPKTYLNQLELARLAILRSALGETRDQREAESLA